MQEVSKRMNAGWVLMDSMSVNGHTIYFLERGEKSKCTIDIEPSGHGWVETSSGRKRI